MTNTTLRFILAGSLLLPASAASFGGWAVITIEDLPDYVVARQPVALTFTVRQHGRTPLSGLNAGVEATAGALPARVAAIPGQAAGEYTATLTLPEPGQWTITIHSGFGNSRITLLPIRVIAPGTRAPGALAVAERGRRLFVAKGCVTCHVHREFTATSVAVGPELTGRQFAADYLKQFLANPAIRPAARGDGFRMPNLNLRQEEIAALVAFLNAERQYSGQ